MTSLDLNYPLFSVLIANYNNGKYLMEAIESIRHQTYTNWEIILIDDGSTDNSIDLYKELVTDKRIHILYNHRNYGCGFTKARCAECANGDVCGYLDPDDVLTEDALEKHIFAHLEHNTASIISSRMYLCDEQMTPQSISRLLQIPQGVSYLEFGEYSPEHFMSFKRSKYALTDGINKDYKFGIDQDLCFKLEEVGDWHVIDTVLYKYRKGIGISWQQRNEVLLWNNLIRMDAAARRHYSTEKRFDICKRALSKYIELEKLDAADQRESIIRASYSYRMGNYILKPLSQVKEIISRYRQKA